MFQIFSQTGSKQKYLDYFFKGSVQLVPSIWLTSFPQPVWIATDSLAIQPLQKTVFNSYPNLSWKWNCKGDIIQIFSSERNLAWENGSQGPYFAKILNSKFLKGLRHSAVMSNKWCRFWMRFPFGLIKPTWKTKFQISFMSCKLKFQPPFLETSWFLIPLEPVFVGLVMWNL